MREIEARKETESAQSSLVFKRITEKGARRKWGEKTKEKKSDETRADKRAGAEFAGWFVTTPPSSLSLSRELCAKSVYIYTSAGCSLELPEISKKKNQRGLARNSHRVSA